MTNCTCIDCMYGGNVGGERGGIALPSNEKGDDEMSEVNQRDFGVPGSAAWWVPDTMDPENGIGYVMPGAVDRAIGSIWKGPGSISRSFGYAYEVSQSGKAKVTLHKEKALQIASEMLDCDGKVEIKRIELN